MEQLLIEQTKYTPRVEMSPAGLIQIQGRSIIEDPYMFYSPILNWVKQKLKRSECSPKLMLKKNRT